jgi:hypothetical protein
MVTDSLPPAQLICSRSACQRSPIKAPRKPLACTIGACSSNQRVPGSVNSSQRSALPPASTTASSRPTTTSIGTSSDRPVATGAARGAAGEGAGESCMAAA